MMAFSIVACSDGLVLNIDGDVDAVPGSGTIEAETRELAGFDQVTLAGEGRVIVVEGREPSLTIETDDNLLPLIETSIRGSTLEITTKSGVDINPTDSVVYRVGAPDVSGLTLTGAGSLELEESEAETFSVVLSGAGSIDIGQLTADTLDVEISGAGNVVGAGSVTSLDVSISGAGDYQGRELESMEAIVSTSGVGSATVWVTKMLDATVTGVGSIDYYGSPKVTESVSGLGSINRRGDG